MEASCVQQGRRARAFVSPGSRASIVYRCSRSYEGARHQRFDTLRSLYPSPPRLRSLSPSHRHPGWLHTHRRHWGGAQLPRRRRSAAGLPPSQLAPAQAQEAVDRLPAAPTPPPQAGAAAPAAAAAWRGLRSARRSGHRRLSGCAPPSWKTSEGAWQGMVLMASLTPKQLHASLLALAPAVDQL